MQENKIHLICMVHKLNSLQRVIACKCNLGSTCLMNDNLCNSQENPRKFSIFLSKPARCIKLSQIMFSHIWSCICNLDEKYDHPSKLNSCFSHLYKIHIKESSLILKNRCIFIRKKIKKFLNFTNAFEEIILILIYK